MQLFLRHLVRKCQNYHFVVASCDNAESTDKDSGQRIKAKAKGRVDLADALNHGPCQKRELVAYF
jgi:hypothetical protein